MNKKGVSEDMIYIPVILFMTAIALLAWAATWDEISPALKEQLGSDPDATNIGAVNYTVEQGETIVQMSDFAFVGGAIGLFVVVAVMAVMIIASPIFLVIYIFVSIVALFIAGALSNAYYTAITSPMLLAAATDLPITNFFMSQLPKILFLFILIIGIIAYAKFGGEARR